MAKRKSKRGQQQAQRFRRLIILSISALAFAWGVTWFYMSDSDVKLVNWMDDQTLKLTSDLGFQVKDVLVEGIENVDPDVLKAVMNVEKGDPLFAFNPVQTKDQIEKISWVKSARVERRFPSTIYIKITERQPLAFWQKDQKLRLIDDEGHVITSERLVRFEKLMVVTGDDAPKHTPKLMASLQSQPSLMARVKSATWVGQRRWDLFLDSGIEVKLPEGQEQEALSRLVEAQTRDQLLDKDIKGIDLREQGRIVVRTAPGQVSEYKRGNQI